MFDATTQKGLPVGGLAMLPCQHFRWHWWQDTGVFRLPCTQSPIFFLGGGGGVQVRGSQTRKKVMKENLYVYAK